MHRSFEPRTGGCGLFGRTHLEVRSDLPHARVSRQYALRLLAEEGGEPGIVEPAVILHDVGWSQLEPEQIRVAFGVRAGGEEAERLNRIHERERAVIARRILQSSTGCARFFLDTQRRMPLYSATSEASSYYHHLHCRTEHGGSGPGPGLPG